jgi:hypothetical protein
VLLGGVLDRTTSEETPNALPSHDVRCRVIVDETQMSGRLREKRIDVATTDEKEI